MRKQFMAGVLAFAAFTGLMMTGCSKTYTLNENPLADSAAETAAAGAASAAETAEGEQTSADGSTIIITLHPEDAPITCENFEKLVGQGFYNGVKFHRVVDDFMAQGGDPTGTGSGNSGETIKGEFSANGVENNRKHVRGTVSMARATDMDSASCQFFICYTTCDFLDGKYAAFGEVTQGMEIVDDFLKVERVMGNDGAMSSPTKPIIMESVQMIENDADGNPRVEIKMNDFLS